MPMSMHSISVPVFAQLLTAPSNVLEKGREQAQPNRSIGHGRVL